MKSTVIAQICKLPKENPNLSHWHEMITLARLIDEL